MAEDAERFDLTKAGNKGFLVGDVNGVEFNVEKAKLRLAAWVLCGLAVLFALALASYVFKASFVDSTATKEVFDFVKVSFPPIVTLILGAYFKSKD